MSRVRERFNKPLWLAIAAQLACLMVGLWIHHRYVLSSLNRASEQEAFSELESLARDAVADRASQSSPHSQTETLELIKQINHRSVEERLDLG